MVRFSLLTLSGVVLVAAIGSAALANPTDIWRQVIVTGTVGILLIAILRAVSKRPLSRFALGFTVTGWLYFVLTFSGVLGVREHLLTEQSVVWLHGKIHDDPAAVAQSNLVQYRLPGPGSVVVPQRIGSAWPAPIYAPAALAGYTTSPMLPSSHNFAVVGRSLWTLILATIGGLFASWLGRRRNTGKS